MTNSPSEQTAHALIHSVRPLNHTIALNKRLDCIFTLQELQVTWCSGFQQPQELNKQLIPIVADYCDLPNTK